MSSAPRLNKQADEVSLLISVTAGTRGSRALAEL